MADLRARDRGAQAHMKRKLSPFLAIPMALAACASSADDLTTGSRAQAATVGAVVITEIVYNPAPGATEWFELFNTTSSDIDLDNWSFKDDKTTYKIAKSLTLPANGRVVLGQDASLATNGGVPVDHAYGAAIGLSSTADELHLFDPSGTEIDTVVFAGKAPWPTSTEGAAISLDPLFHSATANDDPSSWCLATTPFPNPGSAMRGTPGAPNPSCGGGQAGAGGAAGQAGGGSGGGGSGSGGAGQAGAAQGGAGQAGAAQGGAGQAGAPAGGSSGASAGGAGVGGSAGSLGCTVVFHKVDVNQPDATGAPKDTTEAVELRVDGKFTAGKTTLADCGVATIAPYGSNSDATGACGPTAGTYNELAIGDLVAPASGYVVVGNNASSDRPWPGTTQGSAVLKNGPDFLTLRSAGGAVVASVSYADNDAPTVYAACPPSPSTVKTPADANTSGTPPLNQVLALCPDGSWQLVSEANAPWKAPNTCAGASGGAGGAGGGAGAGGVTATGGGSPTGGKAGAAGGTTTGGAATGGGGSAAGGANNGASDEEAPTQNGDCDCRSAAGRSADRVGALSLLLVAAWVGVRRRTQARR